MSVRTITTELTPAFGEPFQILLSLPAVGVSATAKNKVPITCFLGKDGSNTELGCYIYSIFDSRRNETFQTVLVNSHEILLDTGKRLGNLISKKYKVPCFVTVSGPLDFEESSGMVQETIKFISEQLELV